MCCIFYHKWSLVSGILKWAEHYVMIASATASESSSAIIFSYVDISSLAHYIGKCNF